jgi:hypothetical protein
MGDARCAFGAGAEEALGESPGLVRDTAAEPAVPAAAPVRLRVVGGRGLVVEREVVADAEYEAERMQASLERVTLAGGAPPVRRQAGHVVAVDGRGVDVEEGAAHRAPPV